MSHSVEIEITSVVTFSNEQWQEIVRRAKEENTSIAQYIREERRLWWNSLDPDVIQVFDLEDEDEDDL